jgi:hypothetical protein
VFESIYNGPYRTKIRVTGSSEPNKLAPDAIFLFSKFKGNMGGLKEDMFWTGEGVYSNVVDKEVDVTNAKRRRIRIVGMCIFTRSQQEEEAQDDHLADGV